MSGTYSFTVSVGRGYTNADQWYVDIADSDGAVIDTYGPFTHDHAKAQAADVLAGLHQAVME